jgi:ABC-type multidrug transport system ATPase subunit
MVLRIYGADRAGVENSVLELLRELDLLAQALQPLALLSRGQRYKAALAAALVVNPELWLLDEPFASGMDPQGLQTFKTRAQATVAKGHTVIFTTQIPEVVEPFADQVCVLKAGEAVFRQLRQKS